MPRSTTSPPLFTRTIADLQQQRRRAAEQAQQRTEEARKRQAAEEQQREALQRQREQEEARKQAAAEARQVAEQQQREAQQRREQDEDEARRAVSAEPVFVMRPYLISDERHEQPREQPRPEATAAARFADFAVFRDADAPWCPEMVALPAGGFLMGEVEDEKEQQFFDDQGTLHRVTIQRFAIGRYPVTFAEYDHFCDTTKLKRETPGDDGWGRGKRPVINVSWRGCNRLLRLAGEGNRTAVPVAERGGVGVCVPGRNDDALCVWRYQRHSRHLARAPSRLFDGAAGCSGALCNGDAGVPGVTYRRAPCHCERAPPLHATSSHGRAAGFEPATPRPPVSSALPSCAALRSNGDYKGSRSATDTGKSASLALRIIAVPGINSRPH